MNRKNGFNSLWRPWGLLWEAPEGNSAAADGGASPPTSEGAAEGATTQSPSLLSGAADEGTGGAAESAAEAPLTAADITLPEGVTVDEASMASALEVMNAADLSPKERLEKLISLQHEVMTRAAKESEDASLKLWNDTQDQWRKEAQALPELGGAALPKTLATIKKGLEAVGADKSVFEALDVTGAGNHPAIIRVLHALTAKLAEGGPQSGTPTRSSLSQAERLYSKG